MDFSYYDIYHEIISQLAGKDVSTVLKKNNHWYILCSFFLLSLEEYSAWNQIVFILSKHNIE